MTRTTCSVPEGRNRIRPCRRVRPRPWPPRSAPTRVATVALSATATLISTCGRSALARQFASDSRVCASATSAAAPCDAVAGVPIAGITTWPDCSRRRVVASAQFLEDVAVTDAVVRPRSRRCASPVQAEVAHHRRHQVFDVSSPASRMASASTTMMASPSISVPAHQRTMRLDHMGPLQRRTGHEPTSLPTTRPTRAFRRPQAR